MRSLLLVAQGAHLSLCVLATGSAFLLLLAGPPATAPMVRWEQSVLGWIRGFVLAALLSGLVVLAAQTASFEGRPEAALEPGSIARAMLDTRSGLLWAARCGILIVLAAFLFLCGEAKSRPDWLAARGEGFVLAALALVLIGSSSHSAAAAESPWPGVVDMTHLLAAGVWAGALPPLAALLYAASREVAPDPFAVRAMRRFSPIALVAVLALAGTGLMSAWALIGGAAGLVGTTHGRLLLAKLAMLAPALLLAAASRTALPSLSSPSAREASATARRMAGFIAIEAAFVLALIGLAAAMTVTTPAVHEEAVWPLPFRLSPNRLSATAPALVSLGVALAGIALSGLAVARIARRRPALPAAALAIIIFFGGAAFGLRPLIVPAYPTSFSAAAPYTVESIAEGAAVYQTHCASCHGDAGSDGASNRLAPTAARAAAGDLFWLIAHGRPERGMPASDGALDDTQRWRVVSYLRALGAATDPRPLGPEVRPDDAWLAAPDAALSVGPLAPIALRDFRGRKMVLLVLYALPGSRERMTELAKRYGALSVLGVEVVAAAPQSSPAAIAELGQSPPVLFPVVTDGNEAISAAYRLFAPGAAHAEFLIDRQGYVRAIWRSDRTGMPDAAAVQAQVERLNEEKSPPPLPDDHIH